jgi:hypothetical protein
MHLTIRCTAEEKAKWQALASAEGLTISQLFRQRLGEPSPLASVRQAAPAPISQEQPVAAPPASAISAAVRRAAAVPVVACRFAASGGCRRLGKLPCHACQASNAA